MVKTRPNREIVESYYKAVGEKEVDHLYQILAQDVEWIHPALGGAFHGVHSVINDVVIPFWENWELSLDVHRYIEDGNTIVVLATYHGTYRPTGNQVEEPVAHVWDIKDGQIVRFRQYVDTASIRKQLEG